MQAAQFNTYGGPEVLEIAEATEPHAGPGQVRVVVHAASINPMDWKIRAGYLKDMMPTQFPAIPGLDAAGVVDEVGDGVEGVSVGDAVFGLGRASDAELAVLDVFAAKPESLDWATAAALGVAGETAARVFTMLGLASGQTVLVDGGAGGVGAVAVQIAVARGAKVVATASERNQEFLTGLGATAVVYGDGMTDRVRAAAPEGLDAVFDVAGATPLAELVALVDDPAQVVSIANFDTGETGARATGGGEGDPVAALKEVAELATSGKLAVQVRTFGLADIAQAHELSQQGHVRGKLVLVI